MEKASAHIESNVFHDNIKSQIAFGGECSVNVTIIKNQIFNGRIEGIFALDAGKALICRNKIYENNHGIVLITSSPFIMKNKISKNKYNGKPLLLQSTFRALFDVS